jgi:hypothetical protein
MLLAHAPHLEAQVGIAKGPDPWLLVCGMALQVFQQRAFFIQVSQRAFAAHIIEVVSVRGDLLLFLVFQPWQCQILEHHARQLFYRDFGFIDLLTRLISRLLTPLPAFAVASDNIANVALPLASSTFHLAKPEAVLIQVAQGDLDQLFAFRGDDVLLRDQFLQILADRLFDALIVADAVFECPPPKVPGDFRHGYFSRASRLLTYLSSSLAHSAQ